MPQESSTSFFSPIARAKRACSTRSKASRWPTKQSAAEKSPLQFRLTLVGAFASEDEEKELRDFIQQRGVQHISLKFLASFPPNARAGAARRGHFLLSDLLPGGKPARQSDRSDGFGLPIVTTRWRSIPEMLPQNYPGLVDPKSPHQIAAALRRMAASDFTRNTPRTVSPPVSRSNSISPAWPPPSAAWKNRFNVLIYDFAGTRRTNR